MSRQIVWVLAALGLSASATAQTSGRSADGSDAKPETSTFKLVPIGNVDPGITINSSAKPPAPGDLPASWITATGTGRFSPNFPPSSPEAQSAEKIILAFLIPDSQSASVSLEVANWICENPSEVSARIVTLDPYVLTDHDDGDWGVDSDVLFDDFRRPVRIPALQDFVHSSCPKSYTGEGDCEGGIVLQVNNALLNDWEKVLAHEAADSLRAGPDCRLRLLQALTRWFQPRATVHLPPQP